MIQQRLRSLFLALILPGACLLQTGCSMFPDGERWQSAAKKAVTSKRTWVPLAVAAAWSIDDYDQQTSEWAVEHTPVFGDSDDADDFGFKMLDAMMLGAIGTSFTLPGENKLEHGTVTLGAMGTTALTTVYLKIWTERARPDFDPATDDDDNKRSLPSGHSSEAFTVAHILGKNMEYYDLNEQWLTGLDITYQTMAWSVAWSRIEANEHYPTDVLAGAALGNFFAILFQEAWFPDSDVRVNVSQEALGETLTINLSKPF